MQASLDALPEWEEDLVVRYLTSPRGSGLNDLRWSAWPDTLETNIRRFTTFDTAKWSDDDYNQVIRRYTPAQQMEHKYHQTEEVIMLPPEYNPWKDVFEKKASERFPESRSWDHQIVPKRGKIYPLSPKQQNTLDEWIKEHLEKEYIRPSKSPQASPFFFVEKKDKQNLRPCQDYRYLNEHTKPNAYPLPLISDLMIKLKGSKYFTKLDIRWGYNNVQIKESDRWKAAFVTNRGLFEPNVMFFGLRNSPATFQAMMDDYFRDLTEKGWVVIYMDDILIHVHTKQDLEERTKLVLERLRKYDLYLKLEKCKFAAEEVDFLGMVITKDTVKMDPIKLAGIRDWPTPTTVKQIRSFLGFGNYYRKFISGFAHLARPLHELTKKNKIWQWTDNCQTAFDRLKEIFLTAPVLTMPDTTKPFVLQTDASDRAIGAVIMQADANGDLHPCGYLSHALTPTETRWQIYDRELFAIYYALYKEWRYLLEGAEHPVTVYCDHKNLTYYREPQRLTAQQTRWWNDLSRFNFTLTHIPGTKLIIADTLSRRSDHMTKDEPEERITMLPDSLFVNTIAEDLRDKVLIATSTDEFAQSITRCLKEKGTPPLRTALSDWTFDDGIILYKGKSYIPADSDLRREIIKDFHESPISGHPGIFKTLYLLKEHYWWPRMSTMVKQYVDGCSPCQQMKPNTHPTAAPLMPIKSHVHRPFQQITMDFITDLPISDGFDSIFIMVDQGLTKGVILCPCDKMITAEQTANLYIKNVFIHFGLPDVMISDRGPQFASHVFNSIMDALHVKHKMSTAFHPQTDGQTERYNAELEAYLRIFCAYEPDTWNKMIPLAQFAHNSKTHEALRQSPFQLMYGTTPVALPLVSERTNNPAADNRIDLLYKAREEALAAHNLAHIKMAERTMRRSKPFKVNERVWLDSKNLKIPYQSRKIAPKQEGPFTIKDVLGPVTYRLALPRQWKIHNVFHAALLTPFKETTFHGTTDTQPPPDLIEQQAEWEVEAILAHRKQGRRLVYLIKWKGYDTSENTWEPENNLTHTEELLDEYKKRRNL
jgi:hypothetical protein